MGDIAIESGNMTYAQREEMKLKAWDTVADPSGSPDSRKEAVFDLMYAHFDRSEEAWRSSRKLRRAPHARLDEYIQSWLWANGDRLVEDREVLASLRKAHPEPARPHIAKGESYWRPIPVEALFRR